MFPSTFTFYGVTFHAYGLVLGLAIVTALLMSEWVGTKQKIIAISDRTFWNYILVVVLLGMVGARAWHVMTDWNIYSSDWIRALYIWNGGLSIIGGVVGGLVGLGLMTTVGTSDRDGDRNAQKRKKLLELLDVAAFGLPIGQAIGRFGNFINQELYGLPSSAPWAIPIDVTHRLDLYKDFARYHPLFLYEALPLIATWWLLWRMLKKQAQISDKTAKNSTNIPILFGNGVYFLIYVLMYSWVRFWLDFLRLDNPPAFGLPLGFNQLVLLAVVLVAICILIKQKLSSKLAAFYALMFLVSVGTIAAFLQSQKYVGSTNDTHKKVTKPSEIRDHDYIVMQFGETVLRVEAVVTPKSWSQGLSGRSEIGSDGMLFIFPGSRPRQFWMIDMLFDIDIIWMNEGKVIGIFERAPHPTNNEKPRDLPQYNSPGDADWVLEVPAGFARQSGIVTGMSGMITALPYD